MSDTMTEGVVAKWHKKVGDKIKAGDLVADIETDKATMEFESYQEGTLLYRGVEEGQAAPVDAVLAILGNEGEDYKALLEGDKSTTPEKKQDMSPASKDAKTEPAAKAEEKPRPEEKSTPSEKPVPPAKLAPAAKPAPQPIPSSTSDNNRIKASPLARKLSSEKGIDLSNVLGSGEQGRVVKRDIDWYKPGAGRPPEATARIATPPAIQLPESFVTEESFEEIPLSQMRKTIARRLVESKFSAPHFYLTVEIDMDNTVAERESINASTGSKISLNDFVIKAAAFALRVHPKVNASWMADPNKAGHDKIRIAHHVHIGVAVAVEEGLLVPVVRFADGKTLSEINAEVKIFAQKAREKKLQPADWEGNTFTISNLGMYGIEDFTAIINPPDACIMAVGAVMHKPVVKHGAIVPANVMKVTLSCDHRVVDGATGAQFLQTFKGLMENPILMLGIGNI